MTEPIFSAPPDRADVEFEETANQYIKRQRVEFAVWLKREYRFDNMSMRHGRWYPETLSEKEEVLWDEYCRN